MTEPADLAPEASVCVVVAAWNAVGTIRRSVTSALQTGVSEVVVVDDASSDQTAAAAAAADDGTGRLRIIRCSRNAGPAAARNLAIAHSTAEWIAILDADDYFQPDRIERLMTHRGGQDVVADGLLHLDEHDPAGAPQPVWTDPADRHRLSLVEFVKSNISRPDGYRQELGFLKPILRRAFPQTHGLRYRETMRLGEDYELYVRILAAGGRFLLVPPQGYVSVIRADSLSGRHSESDLEALRDSDYVLGRLPGLTEQERMALREHSRSVDCRLQWRRLISGVKSRDLGKIASTFVRPGPVPAYLVVRLMEQAWLRSRPSVRTTAS